MERPEKTTSRRTLTLPAWREASNPRHAKIAALRNLSGDLDLCPRRAMPRLFAPEQGSDFTKRP